MAPDGPLYRLIGLREDGTRVEGRWRRTKPTDEQMQHWRGTMSMLNALVVECDDGQGSTVWAKPPEGWTVHAD